MYNINHIGNEEGDTTRWGDTVSHMYSFKIFFS